MRCRATANADATTGIAEVCSASLSKSKYLIYTIVIIRAMDGMLTMKAENMHHKSEGQKQAIALSSV